MNYRHGSRRPPRRRMRAQLSDYNGKWKDGDSGSGGAGRTFVRFVNLFLFLLVTFVVLVFGGHYFGYGMFLAREGAPAKLWSRLATEVAVPAKKTYVVCYVLGNATGIAVNRDPEEQPQMLARFQCSDALTFDSTKDFEITACKFVNSKGCVKGGMAAGLYIDKSLSTGSGTVVDLQ